MKIRSSNYCWNLGEKIISYQRQLRQSFNLFYQNKRPPNSNSGEDQYQIKMFNKRNGTINGTAQGLKGTINPANKIFHI